MKKFRFILIFSVCIFIITIIFSFSSLYKNIELKWIDTNFKIRGTEPISDDIVIAAIDDQSFKELGQWPFPRSYYAKLIENLEKAGAKIIVFDIEFTEPSNSEDDELLAKTAAKYGNVIFAGKLVKQIIGNAYKKHILKPIKEIEGKNIPWGLVGISQDEDGFVRQYTLFSEFNRKKYYSLGIKTLQQLLQERFNAIPNITNTYDKFGVGHYIFPKYTKNTSFINYYGPAYTFPYYSIDTILDDKSFTVNSEKELADEQINTFDYYLDENTFKDKVVLIGATADELHDFFQTPFYDFHNEKESTPGVEIHANFLEMILQNNSITQFSFLYFFLGLLILCFIINIVFSYLKPGINVIITVVLISAFVYFVYSLFCTKNILLNITEVPTIIVLSFLGNLIRQYYLDYKEKLFIKNAFSHYVSEDVVNHIIKNPKQLKFGGQLQRITILFADIRSFTTFTEVHKPKVVVETLRKYLTAMVDEIKENQGTIDKFVGDAIMALFGVPYKYEDHVYKACKAALQMREKLQELQKEWKEERKDIIEIGIGVHTGEVIVGNLGSEQIFDYTAIGDVVNSASRIESLNKEIETSTHIIISGETYKAVKERVKVRFLKSQTLRGKEKKTDLYELIGFKAKKTLEE